MRVLVLIALLSLLGATSIACVEQTGEPRTQPTPDTASPAATEAADVPDEIREMEQQITERVNDERRAEGLDPLEHRDDLARVARDYSRLMMEEEFFAHEGPEGGTVADRVREEGITFTAVGENLFTSEGPVDHVDVAVEGWMQSPGHRENILRDMYTHTGVGMVLEGGTAYVTQVFLTP
jgi:uncharacterized protein YkwD